MKQAKKDKEIKTEKEWREKKKHFVSFSHEKNGGHPWLRMWGFNSICPFFQSVSARLESLTAAEMRAGHGDSWRRQREHRRTERARGNKTQNSGKSER